MATDLQIRNLALDNMANNVAEYARTDLYGVGDCTDWNKEILRYMVIDAFECCSSVQDNEEFISSNLNKKTKDCYTSILIQS